jgi:SP family arabinose:H+ symporter-like MFS transporter
MLFSRVLLGVAVGIASYTAPLYLSEMASENVRGKMISMYQLMVTLGIVLAFLSDTASATAATGARCWACWRCRRWC